MDRKDLIRRYLDAETTPAQERELAASFAAAPPADEEEQAVYRLLQAVTPLPTEPLPEEGATILAAVVFLTRKPIVPEPEVTDTVELLQRLQLISNLDPSDAESYDFKPVGDGFIMTARFRDGSEASYILAPIDGGQSFHLVSLND